MSEFKPTIKLPFEYIQGIPNSAAVQIRRDFEEIIRNIQNLSMFDAIIDSELAVSNSSAHQYKSLTDLLASEKWTGHFNVGVRQGPTAITETVGNTLAGKGDLSLFALAAPLTNSGSSTGTTEWHWQALAVPAGQVVFMQGLYINPTSSMQVLSSGFGTAVACNFGTNITGFSAAGIAGQGGTLVDCTFRNAIVVNGSIGVNVLNTFYNCQLTAGVTVATQGQAFIYGGECGGFSTSSVNACTVIADFRSSALTVSAGGGVYTNTATNGVGGQATVSDTADSTIVEGMWAGVSFTGTPASGAVRRFSGVCGAGSLDFTGPGQVVCTIGGGANAGRAQLKGNAVNAEIAIVLPLAVGVSPLLNAVGLTNSQVKLSSPDNASGTKAYAFDAASHNNILILSGSLATNFNTTSTDLGTKNRVITEIGDTFGGVSINPLALRAKSQTPPPDDDPFPDWGPFGPDMVPGPRGPRGLKGATGAAGAGGKQKPQTPPPEDDIWDQGPFGPDVMNHMPPPKSNANFVSYTELTASHTIVSTTEGTPDALISSGAIVYRPREICIEFFAPDIAIGSSAGFAVVSLWDGSTNLGILCIAAGANATEVPSHGIRYLTPTAGSHTYKVQCWAQFASLDVIECGAGGIGTRLPAWLRISYTGR